MRTLDYNVAPGRRIDIPRLLIRCAPLVLVSLLCFLTSLGILSGKNQARDAKLAELRRLTARLAEVEETTRGHDREITALKKAWGGKVKFCNRLIELKTYSVIRKLDRLEEVFPEGLRLQSISMKNHRQGGVELKIAAASFPRLVDLYRQLAHYDLNIKSESEENGVYVASLTVEMDDE